jgi:hypothetical protein
LADLVKAELGYALLHIGSTNNDFGAGPKMIQQRYNCQLINKQILMQIKNSHDSTLLNHFKQNAILIGIQKQHII